MMSSARGLGPCIPASAASHSRRPKRAAIASRGVPSTAFPLGQSSLSGCSARLSGGVVIQASRLIAPRASRAPVAGVVSSQGAGHVSSLMMGARSSFLGGSFLRPGTRGAIEQAPRGAGGRGRGHVVVLAFESADAGFEEMAAAPGRRYFMLGGKGGVGKTSLAASLAVKFANAGHQTLVVSTDPAHSLSDSLAQDVSGGEPVIVQGTDYPLYAMEIDPEAAKEEFYEKMQRPDTSAKVKDFLGGVGLGGFADKIAELNLGELLDTPPPGLDEAIAIAKVVEFVNNEKYARFTRIVFDTAPTGHTLRMLRLPEFLDASVGKIIRLRKKITGAGSAIKGLFGIVEGEDKTEAELNDLKAKVITVRDLLRDKDQMEFIIATIPTVMAATESTRLLKSLRSEGVPCKRIIVNQCLPEGASESFYELKRKDQEKAMQLASSDAGLRTLERIDAPLFDLEVRGVPALQFFGSSVWTSDSGFDSIAAGKDRKYIMLGGKGGVGKTSLSASLAVKLAMEGHRTLVVSTDPAHSLSDSLSQDVSGGRPVPVTEGGAGIPLYGMQVDAEAAREEFRAFALDGGANDLMDKAASMGLGAIVEQIKDLQLGELMDNPPPGVDEAVAVSNIIEMIESEEYSDFTRVVFDTAPTGHTLRLLTLPDFVEATLGKVVRLRAMLGSAGSMVTQFLGGEKEQDEQVAKLEKLKGKVNKARDLFRAEGTTEFVIVTIPTVMAVSESSRLLAALRAEKVPCRRMVVNQVLQEDQASKEAFLGRKYKDQRRAIDIIDGDPELKDLRRVGAPLFDLEVRGVGALQYFGDQVWKE